tara:strand:- start:1031 stop:1318 length:288 start_codon:yes stop_codon:yes gene_type:complete
VSRCWSARAGDVGIIGANALYWEKVFREAYVPTNSIQFIDDFSKFKVLVVTPNAVRDDSAPFVRNAEKFKQFVKDGGFLLSLQSGRNHYESSRAR